MKDKALTVEEVREYWDKKNIPQQWYSDRKPYTLAWFNELSFKRYTRYYAYFREVFEFTFHSGERVLEVGCGIGTDLIEYAKNGAKVTGVDLGEDQIELTKRNFALRGLPYEELRVSNAEELPFGDAVFDLVVSIGVLHHTPNTGKAIAEIRRVLKPDGRAIILVYARGWKHYIKRCLVHGILRGRWFHHRFDWKKVYGEISEVHGNSPKTDVYTKKQVKKLFRDFPSFSAKKQRLGEFFDYAPYNSRRFPRWFSNLCYLFALERILGENWIVKVGKATPPPRGKLWDVWWKHY